MKNLHRPLQSTGLTEKERDVYLAILSLGKGTITNIAKRSNLKRTSIYQYVEVLLQENLISQTVVKKRIFYIAENPRKILTLLEKKKTTLEKSKQAIEDILPDLESLYSLSFIKPEIRLYEGKDGLRTVYREMVTHHKNILSFFSPKKFFSLFTYEDNDAILMALKKNGGTLTNLVEKSDEAIKRLQIQKYASFVKSKTLPKNFTFDTDFLIGNGTIAHISFDKKVAVIIQDPAIAHLQKNIFKTLWNKNF